MNICITKGWPDNHPFISGFPFGLFSQWILFISATTNLLQTTVTHPLTVKLKSQQIHPFLLLPWGSYTYFSPCFQTTLSRLTASWSFPLSEWFLDFNSVTTFLGELSWKVNSARYRTTEHHVIFKGLNTFVNLYLIGVCFSHWMTSSMRPRTIIVICWPHIPNA